MDGHPEYDARRTAWLDSHGVEVIRIPARDVLRDADEAAENIWLIIRTRQRDE